MTTRGGRGREERDVEARRGQNTEETPREETPQEAQGTIQRQREAAERMSPVLERGVKISSEELEGDTTGGKIIFYLYMPDSPPEMERRLSRALREHGINTRTINTSGFVRLSRVESIKAETLREILPEGTMVLQKMPRSRGTFKDVFSEEVLHF